jgi:hypothetical protein
MVFFARGSESERSEIRNISSLSQKKEFDIKNVNGSDYNYN